MSNIICTGWRWDCASQWFYNSWSHPWWRPQSHQVQGWNCAESYTWVTISWLMVLLLPGALDGNACHPHESGCPPQLLQVALEHVPQWFRFWPHVLLTASCSWQFCSHDYCFAWAHLRYDWWWNYIQALWCTHVWLTAAIATGTVVEVVVVIVVVVVVIVLVVVVVVVFWEGEAATVAVVIILPEIWMMPMIVMMVIMIKIITVMMMKIMINWSMWW